LVIGLFKKLIFDSKFQNDLSNVAFPIISDLRKSHTLCDVVIKVGDVTFKAHKIVLVSFLLNFVHFVTGGRGVKANMFVPGNTFQPNQIFVAKASRLRL
jgi:hypothetical protein